MQAPQSRATGALDRTLALTCALGLTALLSASCAVPSADRADGARAPESGDTGTAAPTPIASIVGDDVLLVAPDGSRAVIASTDEAELLQAEVRPGREPDDPVTVLALTRVEERYELRYVTVADGDPTDLYWFPSRLQVSPDLAQVADVPPLPVWAPDGSGLAWLEWDHDGTRLRTVGWFDHDHGTNPSDDQATYAVPDLPLGTQLASWEFDEDGTPVLVTRGEGQDRWRIRIEDGEPVVALEPAS
ncbi:hypothetical protein [Nitriliruptor alkaliphilus]|uniref:hypothetical protein n=1 Tax=Nitriliruptor alkaliphilus TaxID=427918 RepID=UPI0012EE37E9|nr:hypothetical protein [Nitriliruptor alkaliphilus]